VQYELMRLLTGPSKMFASSVTRTSPSTAGAAQMFHSPEFFKGFPAARIVRLEHNYRSTQNILNAAGAVVANNPERLGKSLSAEKGGGANLKYFEARDARPRLNSSRRAGAHPE